MPLEKEFTKQFFSSDPPVIPVKFFIQKGIGNPTITSHKGWEGFELLPINGEVKAYATKDFTLKSLSDGYAEIPATKNNKKLLEILTKPIKVEITYDKGVRRNISNGKLEFKNKKGNWQFVDKESLDEGDIRIVGNEHELPAKIKTLQSRRTFDINNKHDKEDDLVQKVRPWLRKYINVPGAIMESAHI